MKKQTVSAKKIIWTLLLLVGGLKAYGQTYDATFLKKLTGEFAGTNGRVAGDQFGDYSISVSGDIMVVGARSQDYDSAGGNIISNAGAAYVFYRNSGGTDNWGFVKKLTGKGTNGRVSNDQFGRSLSIDGDVIVVGAKDNSYDSAGGNFMSSAGAAYVFYRNSGGTDNWGFVKKLTGKGTNGRVSNDQFGYHVSVSGDVIVAGAEKQGYDSAGGNFTSSAGAAYVFHRNSGGTDNWGFVKKLTGKGTNGRVASDQFGHSVSLDGDIIVVGAHLQDYDSAGGNIKSEAGAAYVFYRNSGGTDNWGLVKKLTGKGTNGRVASDNFGVSVSVNEDVIVVGANAQGYDSAGGNFMSSGAGAAYVFHRNLGGMDNWGCIKKLTGEFAGTNGRVDGDQLGISVSVSGDVIVAGAYIQGYDSAGGNFTSSAGAAYVFHRNSGGTDNWGFVKKLTGKGTNGRVINDVFGRSVSVSGDVIVAGAYSQDYDSAGGNLMSSAGAAYVFNVSGLTLTLTYSSGAWGPRSPSSSSSAYPAFVIQGTAPVSAGAAVTSFSVSTGAVASLSGNLTLSNSYTNNGTVNGAGTIVLGGSSNQTISGNGTTANLTLDNSTGATISNVSGDSLKISGILTLTSGTLTTNSKLKLTATGATTYGQIAGTGTGTISGNLITECQILTGDGGWRPISSPLNGGTLSELTDDLPLNFGTPTSSYTTVFTFNESRSPSWQTPLSTSSMDDSCFSIYIGKNGTWGVPAYLDVTGTYRGTSDYTVNNLSYTGSVSDTSGWHYMRNPWPSGFLWDGTISNIQGNQVYLYDQNGGSGGFYRVYDNTSQGVIPPFAALLFQVTANNVSVTLPNSKRNTDSLKNVFDKTFPADNYIELSVNKKGEAATDYLKFYTDPAADNTFDAMDGVDKKNDPSMPNLYFSTGVYNLNKQVFNHIPQGVTKLPLLFETTTNSSYVISYRIENLAPGVQVYIEDLNTPQRTKYPVQTGGTMEIPYAGSGEALRYYLVIENTNDSNSTGIEESKLRALVVSQVSGTGTVLINGYLPQNTQITLTDVMGREVYRKTLTETAQGITSVEPRGLAAGYYLLNITGNQIKTTHKILVK